MCRAILRRELTAAVLIAVLAGSAAAQNYSWDRVLELPDDIQALAISGNYLWAAGRIGGDIYRSGNGMQWTGISTLKLQKQEELSCLAYNARRGVLLAGSTFEIYRSTDNGSSWQTAQAQVKAPVLSLLADAGNGSTLFAATADGILRSTDGGWIWDVDGLSGLRINDLAYANGYFYAATDNGIFSRSASQSWSAATLSYPNSGVAALVVGDSGRVYASLHSGVQNIIVYTSDNGSSWNTGMYSAPVPPVPSPMAVSPDGRLFAYGLNTLYSWRQPGIAREETRLKDAIAPGDFNAGDMLVDPVSGHAYICGRYQGSTATSGRIYRSAVPTSETPSHLQVMRSPQSGPSGWTLSPHPLVGVLDGYGVLLSRAGVSVTAMLSGGAPGAKLSGAPTRKTASNGIAVFPDLRIDLAAKNYELVFQSSGLQAAVSAAFDILPGAPASMIFTAWPDSGVVGETLDVFTAELRDSSGNSTTNITPELLLTKSPAAGTMSGTALAQLVNGRASWDDISVDIAGDYTFTAQYGSAITASTPVVHIVPAPEAVAMRFEQVIPTVRAGEVFQTRVHLVDTNGDRVRKDTREVRLRLGNDPPPDTLHGVTTRAAQEGEAVFDQLTLRRAGTGYYLLAEADGLPLATSNTFTVAAGTPERLRITNTMADVVVDETFALTVEVLDRHGNRNNDFTQSVSLTLQGNGPGQLRGTLQKIVRGSEVFSGLSIDAAGEGYRIAAVSSGLTSDTSNAFAVRVPTANRLRFTVQPSGDNADVPLPAQPRISVVDADGRPVDVDGLDVTLSVLDQPGVDLEGGANPVSTVDGVAGFSGLRIREAGAGYRLVAEAAGVIADTSDAFSIRHGAAARMLFRSQPGNAEVDAVIPTVVVGVEDQWQNIVTETPVQVALSLENDPSGSAILSGRSPRNTVSGEATFDALSIDKPGEGYTLRATSPGLPNAVSQPFNIIGPGEAFRVAFEAWPANGSADQSLSPQPVVTVLDADGRQVDNSSARVELSVLDNRTALLGTATVNAEQGRAAFSGLRIPEAGAGYALVARSAGLIPDTSDLFDIAPGLPVQLVFLQQPGDAAINQVLDPEIAITVMDSEMNIVDSSTAWIQMEFESNPGQANLNGSTAVRLSGGIAVFDDLSVDTPGEGYRLRARSAGLQSAVSDPFSVTPGAPARLVFLQQPGDAAVDEAIAPEIVVGVTDSDMNIVDSSSAWITLEIGSNPGSAVLHGTVSRRASDGRASFDDISLDAPGSGFTLRAFAAGLAFAESGEFDVAGETELIMTITGGNDQRAVTGTTLPQALEVTVHYGGGQPAEGVSVEFQLAQPPGASGGQLDPLQGSTGADGTVRTQLTLGDRIGTYEVTATSNGVTGSPLLFTATAEPRPYPATVDLDHVWRFAYHEDRGAYIPSDYRIVSLPGDAGIDIATLLTGGQNENWKLFTDDGSAGDPSAYLLPHDGGARFQARPGRAFWLLHRGDVAVDRTVLSAPVDAGRNATISLHEGWNLIGNPFPQTLSWSVVQQVNGVSDPLYRFDDVRSTHSSFEPYYGYYYFNRDDRPSLLIPWDSLFTTTRFSADDRGWTVGISLAYGTVTDRTLSFGVHPEAENAFDRRDYPAPRGIGSVFASFTHPEWEGAQRFCGRDMRSSELTEHQWTLSIEAETREAVVLSFDGLDAVPPDVELLLEVPLTGRQVSLRDQMQYPVFTGDAPSILHILARPSAGQRAADPPLAGEIRIGAPYPNPTSRGAAFDLRVARDAVVGITVHDMLGRVCRVIHTGPIRSGSRLYYWDGRDDAGRPVPAGLYFIHAHGGSSRQTSPPLFILAH